jgi:SAM-dependent methyltransferase
MEVCSQHQIELLGTSKVLTKDDLAAASHIFALDEGNAHSIFLLDPKEEYVEKVYFLREFSSLPAKDFSIPDPMGKTKQEFEMAYKMIFDCCVNITKKLLDGLPPAKGYQLAERAPFEQDREVDFANFLRSYKTAFQGKNCLLLGSQRESISHTIAQISDSVMIVDSIPPTSVTQPKNLEFRQLKLNKISTIEKTFDLILCFDSLDYVFPERVGELMEILKHLLNETGVLLLSTRGEASASQWKEIFANYYTHYHCPQIAAFPASLLEIFSKREHNQSFTFFASTDKEALEFFSNQKQEIPAEQEDSK